VLSDRPDFIVIIIFTFTVHVLLTGSEVTSLWRYSSVHIIINVTMC